MTRSFLSSRLLALTLAALAGCGGDDANPFIDDGSAEDAAVVTDADATSTDVPTLAVSARGTVHDTEGRPIEGARVSVVGGTQSVRSDASGDVTLELDRSATLAVTKEGHAEQFVVLTLPAEGGTVFFDAALRPREAPRTLPHAEAGGAASGRHGARVELPANAVVDASGKPVTGPIEISMTPVDVSGRERTAFPGAFEGTMQDGVRVPIESYGTTEIVMMQGDRELNLLPGTHATIELPLYPSQHSDGTPVVKGDVIPLWSLNESTGIWASEGTGTVVESAASPTGLALRGVAGHFSWWNADKPGALVPVRVRARARAPLQIIRGMSIRVLMGSGVSPLRSLTTYLGTPSGTVPFPPGSMVTVAISAVAQNPNGMSFVVSKTVSVNVTGDSAIDVELDEITPLDVTITSPTGELTTSGIVPFTGMVSGAFDKLTLLATDVSDPDARPIELVSQTDANLSFAWDTRTVPQARYRVVAEAVQGFLQVVSEPVFVTVVRDGTPPEAHFTRVQRLEQAAFTFAFDPRETRSSAAIVSFRYDFGDGDQTLRRSGEIVTHRFTTSGTYSVSLTVVDVDGGRSTTQQEIFIRSGESLGAIELAIDDVALAERQRTRLTARIPGSTQALTYEARYSATHPNEFLRGQCIEELSDCAVLVPAGETFTARLFLESPLIHRGAPLRAAFEAYDEPITITALAANGDFSRLDTTIHVPAMRELEIGVAEPGTCNRMRRFDAANEWLSFDVTSDASTFAGITIYDETSGLFNLTRATDLVAGQTTQLIPERGRGTTGVIYYFCKSFEHAMTTTTQPVRAKGTLAVGTRTTLPLTARGEFYVLTGVLEEPEVFGIFGGRRSQIALLATGGILEVRGTDDSYGSSTRCNGCTFVESGFNVDPSVPAERVIRVRSEDGQPGFVDLYIEMPRPRVPVVLDQAVSVFSPFGRLPGIVEVSAPEGEWVLITNDTETNPSHLAVFPLFTDAPAWTIANPSISRSSEVNYRVARSNGIPQRFTIEQNPFFFTPPAVVPGIRADVLARPSRALLTSGTTFESHLNGERPVFSQSYATLFTFDADAGQTMTLRMAAHDQLSAAIITPNGQFLRQCFSRQTGNGACVNVPVSLPASGRYALVLHTDTDQPAIHVRATFELE